MKRELKEQLWHVREGGGRGKGHFKKWSPFKMFDKERKELE